MTEPDMFDRYRDDFLGVWCCGTCNKVLRSDGECTTRKCAADAEIKRLGLK